MRHQPDQVVMDWFTERTGVIFYVSAITQAEIMLGISLLSANVGMILTLYNPWQT
jgi:hypothetical protein